MYSPQLLDHFEHPRNAGILAGAQVSVQMENPACGDVLRLTANLNEGTITEIRFQTKGCVAAIACGSALTELASGKTILQASAITRDNVIAEIGSLPPASSHAAQLAIDALRALLTAMRQV